jgi:hypothetical protein
MSDIVTTRIFTDGEKGITATKMNDIIGGSTIQPSFVSGKPVASTVDPADQMLVLKAAGTYAQAPFSTVISSVSSQLPSSDPEIWSVRLRSFNAVGNPSFEIDQKNVGGSLLNVPSGSRMVDRWLWSKSGSATFQINSQQTSEFVSVPGTSFLITQRPLALTLATAQATLAAGDYGFMQQPVEGPRLRELFNDVHSVSILIKSTKANHKFSYFINDPTGSRSFTKLCTIPNANTWTLITIPNIPVFPPSGSWSLNPGSLGMTEGLCFGCGTTNTSISDGVWTNSGAIASPGTDNWFSNPISTTLVTMAFVQHEAGAQCSTLMDKPFTQNYDECLRYYCKSYQYGTAIGTANQQPGLISGLVSASSLTLVVQPVFFQKPMAKQPTVVPYSYAGVANQTTGPTIVTVSGVGAIGEKGYSSLTIPSSTAGYLFQNHYVVDTGW